MSDKRTRDGKYATGNTGNPGNRNGAGRPKGSITLTTMIREMTDGGRPLVETMMAMAQGRAPFPDNEDLKPTTRDVREAIAWLADRGWGKAVQAVEHGAAEGQKLSFHIDLGESK